jgi:hypothetical protein
VIRYQAMDVGSCGNVFTESLPSSGSIRHNILNMLLNITCSRPERRAESFRRKVYL